VSSLQWGREESTIVCQYHLSSISSVERDAVCVLWTAVGDCHAYESHFFLRPWPSIIYWRHSYRVFLLYSVLCQPPVFNIAVHTTKRLYFWFVISRLPTGKRSIVMCASVCLCVRASVRDHTPELHARSSPILVHATCAPGSVLFCWRCDTLCMYFRSYRWRHICTYGQEYATWKGVYSEAVSGDSRIWHCDEYLNWLTSGQQLISTIALVRQWRRIQEVNVRGKQHR